MAVIASAVRRGRPATTDIIPGTVVRHFLYKSRGNVQFVMPSYEPHFLSLPGRRRLILFLELSQQSTNEICRLISSYHTLHASVHAKTAHLKVHHCMSRDTTSLAWLTPVFELYCIAGPHASRNALAQSANKIVQWVRREEERIFIIGGAVRLSHDSVSLVQVRADKRHRSSSLTNSARQSDSPPSKCDSLSREPYWEIVVLAISSSGNQEA